MTLVRTFELDEFGVPEEVLVCETNKRGKYVWNPTPEQYSAYRAREAVLAANEALVQLVVAEPRTRRVVELGTPATDYYTRVTRGKTQVRPYGSDGRYLRTSVVSGGVPCTREQLYTFGDHCKPVEVLHLYNELTFRCAVNDMGGQVCAGPIVGRKETTEEPVHGSSNHPCVSLDPTCTGW